MRLPQILVPSIRPRGGPDDVVGEEGEAVADGRCIGETEGLLAAGLAEEAIPGTEHDWVDEQPQFVDEVVLEQRVPELVAGVDHDVSVTLPFQLGDLLDGVATQERGWSPCGGLFAQHGRHDVLGQAVQAVGPLATARCPTGGEELVAAPTEEQGLGSHGLSGFGLGPRFAVPAP